MFLAVLNVNFHHQFLYKPILFLATQTIKGGIHSLKVSVYINYMWCTDLFAWFKLGVLAYDFDRGILKI